MNGKSFVFQSGYPLSGLFAIKACMMVVIYEQVFLSLQRTPEALLE